MAEKLKVNENLFLNIDALNKFIEENKIKKNEIQSITNITSEGLYDMTQALEDGRLPRFTYRLIWIRDEEDSPTVLNG